MKLTPSKHAFGMFLDIHIPKIGPIAHEELGLLTGMRPYKNIPPETPVHG